MQLNDLHVLHHVKGKSPAPTLESTPGWWTLETCQRTLSIRYAPAPAAAGAVQGVAAYELLLRIAAGLESEVQGETDVFGQFKRAWAEAAPEAKRVLDPWFARIFEDVKQIRSQHLSGIGGQSYGSLVRRLLRTHLSPQSTLLLVGAGKLGASVAPLLKEFDVRLTNRTEDSARALATRLGARFEQDEVAQWKHAAAVVLCIPTDAERDPERVRAWQETQPVVIHLGLRSSSEAGAWGGLGSRLLTLEEIFACDREQGTLRSLQLAAAAKACRERAQLRGLGTSLHIAHGWEDLALFA